METAASNMAKLSLDHATRQGTSTSTANKPSPPPPMQPSPAPAMQPSAPPPLSDTNSIAEQTPAKNWIWVLIIMLLATSVVLLTKAKTRVSS